MRAAKVQASLRICAVSPEPSLLAHTSSESTGTFRQKARSLAPLNGWACAVKIFHDGMLEDTNSLGGAHIIKHKHHTYLLCSFSPASLGHRNTYTIHQCSHTSRYSCTADTVHTRLHPPHTFSPFCHLHRYTHACRWGWYKFRRTHMRWPSHNIRPHLKVRNSCEIRKTKLHVLSNQKVGKTYTEFTPTEQLTVCFEP